MTTTPNKPSRPRAGEAAEQPIDALGKKIGMWFFLFTELLFFGGMFLLYSVFRYRYPADFHRAAGQESIVLGSINTAVLLTSSLCMALALAAIRRGRSRLSMVWQAGTVSLGLVFLVIKGLEWSLKIGRGIYPNGPALLALPRGQILFFGLYYTMTGLHGLHVLIGVAVIAVMMHETQRGLIDSRNFARLENTGLFWHFVDIIWIYLFPLFYLIT